MLETLTGFVVVGLAIAVGYVIGRIDLLGEHAGPVLARLTFFVLSPFLLFVVLAEADVRTLFSALLPVSAIAAVAVIALYVLISRFVWRRSAGEVMIGALSAGQVNSNNIGIPLSLYLLGSAAYPAPVILMQLLVFTPISIAVLEAATAGKGSFGRAVGTSADQPARDRIGAGHRRLGERSGASGDRLRAGAADRQRLRSGAADQLRHLAVRPAGARARPAGAATSSWQQD